MSESRGRTISSRECEVIMVLPYMVKKRSPSSCCAVHLDPPMSEKAWRGIKLAFRMLPYSKQNGMA